MRYSPSLHHSLLRRFAVVPSAIVVLMSGFIAGVPGVKAQTSTPSTNGCSYSPDGIPLLYDFKSACNNHDICYSQGSGIRRIDCDDRFKEEMLDSCTKQFLGKVGKVIDKIPVFGEYVVSKYEPCKRSALLYYKAVRTLSRSYYHGEACRIGYVWRNATPGDRVCVTWGGRDQAVYDNSQAIFRRNPEGGDYGPDTCFFGYVWREATPGDHVCVTPETRSQAADDNSQAAARFDRS
jgi:hypothetical protein